LFHHSFRLNFVFLKCFFPSLFHLFVSKLQTQKSAVLHFFISSLKVLFDAIQNFYRMKRTTTASFGLFYQLVTMVLFDLECAIWTRLISLKNIRLFILSRSLHFDSICIFRIPPSKFE
jgi:hypothetical protein